MGLCDPQLIHQEQIEHSYESGRTWSFLLGAVRTPVPDLRDLKAMNISHMGLPTFIYKT